MNVEQRARELLAAEIEKIEGYKLAAQIRAKLVAQIRAGSQLGPIMAVCHAAIIAALTPPDGWVLMPRVLTEEMLQAGYPADDAQTGYEAMVAARPEVKP
nr:hypothetical protein [Stenotrophomonas geniculata]